MRETSWAFKEQFLKSESKKMILVQVPAVCDHFSIAEYLQSPRRLTDYQSCTQKVGDLLSIPGQARDAR
jgi:hypothetical protein